MRLTGNQPQDAGKGGVFASQASFMEYLSHHLKCKAAVALLLSGDYSIAARQAVTQVTVSKIVDVFGHLPSTAIKTKIACYLADLTRMNASDFFDPKTHKGFLNKDLENRRRKLPPEQKRWVWTKKGKTDSDDGKSALGSDGKSASGSEDLPARKGCEELLEIELEGCSRGLAECTTCGGLLAIIIYLTLILCANNKRNGQ